MSTDPTPGAVLVDPLATPASAEWQAACGRGELLIGRCRICARAHFFPRGHCPHCHAGDVGMEPAAGRGSVYAWTTVHARPQPYTVAYVRLDEGVTMLTQLLGIPAGRWSCGARVRVAWAQAPAGATLPVFEPEEGTEA